VRLAILGGSFNPVHLGHLHLAGSVVSACGYDRLILIPAHISPFKRRGEHAGSQDRLDMLLASIPADPKLSVDDMELKRRGVSYTVDTVNAVIDKYRPRGKPALILGDDLAADFYRWKSAEEIAAKADIILARRVEPPPVFQFPFPHHVLKNDVMAVSSQKIREYIATDGPWRYLVPEGARIIIEERGLYGKAAPSVSAELTAAVEEAARKTLAPPRFLHSRSTALMARDLALRFGLDPAEAYLAGIAHDLGKPFTKKKMLALAEKDGKPLSALEKKKPGLLHGRAAAVLLRGRFKVHNKRVLEAVALHTSGAADMGPLAMALYIADKIEFSREAVNPALREMAENSLRLGEPALPSLLLAVLEDNAAYLAAHRLELLPATAELLQKLRKEPA
jgi:nicotinate-nucleotide adenylyltransferase